MEMATRVNLTAWLIMVISAGFIMVHPAAATTYTVGDELGWTVPPNISYYQSWAASKTFMVGDELLFPWNGMQNVAEVSKADYDNCTSLSMGSPIISMKLLIRGSHYYICTIDSHCKLGQKLSITVRSDTTTLPSLPSPPPPSNSAPSTLLNSRVLVSACITIAYCVIILASKLNVIHYVG